MALVDLSKPGEKKKLIFAGVLGLGAIIVLYWVLIGFDSRPPAQTRTTPAATPQRPTSTAQRPAAPVPVSQQVLEASRLAPIEFLPSSYNAPEAKRNIFAYYEPPAKPVNVPSTPTPTPTPPPPVLLASVSPSNEIEDATFDYDYGK